MIRRAIYFGLFLDWTYLGAVPINRNAQISRRESYKDYVINIIKESNNSWKAKVTRKDGALIRVKYGDAPVSSITTGARYSEEDALDEAKNMIDGGGMDNPA